MSTEVLKLEESEQINFSSLNSQKQEGESIQTTSSEKKPFIPFTKKWRVKLYLLNDNGQWDDKGIGYAFLANEIKGQGNGVYNNNESPTQMEKNLIMLKENTEELILNINLLKENLEFHNQRGTILTWKSGGVSDEDNIAISFQEKEGITDIFRNIRIIKGENVQEEDIFFEEETPFDILKDVTLENLPNILREIPIDMDESKINDLVNYLEMSNCEFIKKMGDLLINEEKKMEEIKSSLSLNSQETDISLNLKKYNGKETINDITEKIINMGENDRKFENKNNNPPFMANENINYIFNIFKNMILSGNRSLLELLFDDNNYLTTFGALEHEAQSNSVIPHRKYFKEIVKFKNPLNITDSSLIQKINQNLRLTYLRDTVIGRIINENTNKAINLIIQMNHSDIIQFFINNNEYLKLLFSQMHSDNINVKKDAILFLSELISCSKNVVQSRVTFNEVLCENGILPILSKLIEENSKENNDINDSISELININIIEIFISILSSVPLLIRQYLIHNSGQTLSHLTNLLLYHNNFPIKYEISQIFKTLLEGEGDPSSKTIFFSSTIDKFISYLNEPSSKTNNKNEISLTIQIIIEIFLTWFNNMDFEPGFWLNKYEINKVIIKLLKNESKIVILYAIKLLKIILDTCENYLVNKIINLDLCKILINLFKENMKKHNIIFSCLMNFFDSISLTNDYVFNTIMAYCNDFIYENKDLFQNIILRYERRPTPKRQLAGYLMRTYTDNSLGQFPMLKNFEDSKSNEDEDFIYNESLFRNEDDEDELNDEDEGEMISKTNLNYFSCIENNNEYSRLRFLKRKRKMIKPEEDIIMRYEAGEEEEEGKDKNNEHKYINMSNYNHLFYKEEDLKNKKGKVAPINDNEEEELCGIYLQEEEY